VNQVYGQGGVLLIQNAGEAKQGGFKGNQHTGPCQNSAKDHTIGTGKKLQSWRTCRIARVVARSYARRISRVGNEQSGLRRLERAKTQIRGSGAVAQARKALLAEKGKENIVQAQKERHGISLSKVDKDRNHNTQQELAKDFIATKKKESSRLPSRLGTL
jgi:glutamate dehydrogenase/leucine dehydrogenase